MKNTKRSPATDQHIAKVLRERIRWDSRISSRDLRVLVHEGQAILSGMVDRPFRRNAAIEVARSTEGVHDVVDQIIVPAHYERSDEDLQKILQEQINSITLENSEKILVRVANAKIYLTGNVHLPRIKANAARIAWELSGVRDCINAIDITEPPMAHIFINQKPTSSIERSLQKIERFKQPRQIRTVA